MKGAISASADAEVGTFVLKLSIISLKVLEECCTSGLLFKARCIQYPQCNLATE